LRVEKPSPRTHAAAGETLLPCPDLVWLEGRKTVWSFYLLPESRVMRRLCPTLKPVAPPIVCIDVSGNVGVMEPPRLAKYLEERAAAPARETIRRIVPDIPQGSVPSPDFHIRGVVLRNHQFVKDHFSLRIRAGMVQRPVPGQFLQVLCDRAPHERSPKYRSHSYSDRRWLKFQDPELLGVRPFLRRPFSIASYGPSAQRDVRLFGLEWLQLINWVESEIEIIYKRLFEGPGTGALAAHRVGDEIDVVGPLGKGFAVAPPPEVALLVGGGIGAPPLLFLAEELVRRNVEVKVFLGALTKRNVPFRLSGKPAYRVARFERLGLRPAICTDDGSAGYHGLVTDPLLKYLERGHKAERPTRLFACGPRSMLAALSGIANRYGLPCEALLEERMACGFGACISCVCAVKETGQKARYTRICTEGPAFDVEKVMWHA
jgi:dihydroorotate dehydrogenase electron transfer subunit